MNSRCLLFILVFALLSSKLLAQVELQQYWHYTSRDTVSLAHINKVPFKHLEINQESLPFHNNGVYWFRLDIQNQHPHKGLVIDVRNPHLDTVVLYQYVNGKILATDTSGNNFKFNNHTFLRYIRFQVGGETSTVWLKARLKKEILFPVTVSTVTDFYKAESLSFLKLGIYYGIAAMMLIVNIVLYFSFKEPKFLYYSILILIIALLYAYADGLFVLINSSSIWLNYASLPLMLGAAIMSVVFSIRFLELDNRYVYLFRLSIALLIVMAVCFLAYIVFDWTEACILGNMMLPLLITLYWLVALSRFKKHTEARFFVFAAMLSLMFGLMFFIFRFMGANFLNLMPNELKIAHIFQIFILSMGILHRVKKLHKEHTYYREEIQRYLKNRPTEKQEKKQRVQVEDVFASLQEQFNLSEREIEVLKLLTEGLTNQQIGEKLYLSSNTVKFHIRNIYLKMDINNRAQAVSKIHGVASS